MQWAANLNFSFMSRQHTFEQFWLAVVIAEAERFEPLDFLA